MCSVLKAKNTANCRECIYVHLASNNRFYDDFDEMMLSYSLQDSYTCTRGPWKKMQTRIAHTIPKGDGNGFGVASCLSLLQNLIVMYLKTPN